jgi:hypothetical protein
MAKRRDLKKTIEYLSGEWMIRTWICSLQPEADQSQLGEMMTRICAMNEEYRRRIQHPSGKADKRQVKQYYRRLCEDFDAELNRIEEELTLLNKENTRN